MRKIKEYRYSAIYKGIQFDKIVCSDFKNMAAIKLGLSKYKMDNYVYSYEPRTMVAIGNIYDVFSVWPRSGVLSNYSPEQIGKIYRLEKMENFISEFRKTYPTNRDYYENL